ncbi:nitroreductase family protein [Curtobacterium flaccumfaciens]|nr:nitroreductase family protein [Curtobacterium flaccumfaciens]
MAVRPGRGARHDRPRRRDQRLVDDQDHGRGHLLRAVPPVLPVLAGRDGRASRRHAVRQASRAAQAVHETGVHEARAAPDEHAPGAAHARRGEPEARGRAPLLLGVMLDRHEYRKEELSGFYSVFSMGAAVENIWLATTELGLGIQFVSFPMETPGAWAEIEGLLRVPESLELMAVYRIGYLPPERRRPAIDWTSSERKRPSQYVFRGTCDTPQQGWDDAPVAGRIAPETTTP